MSKDDKYSLDPEELFKRLGDKQAHNEEPLDDFEQEALDGFAMLGDEQQARDAYQEVLVRLSQKNSGQQKPERKTRIVWLSAAAIVAAMLIVGTVWLNDKGGVAHEDLVMNTQETKAPVSAAAPLPPAVETEEPVNEPAQGGVNAKQKEVSVTSPDLRRDMTTNAPMEQPVFERTIEDREQADEKPQEKLKEATVSNGAYDNAKGESFSSYGYASPPDGKRKNDGPLSISKADNGKALARSEDKSEKYKAKEEEKDQDNKHDSNREDAAGNSNSLADAATAPPTVSESANAQQLETVTTKNEGKKSAGDLKSAKEQEAQIARYYAPGEKALKDHLAAKAGSKTLSGAYTVKASVSSDGKLKVASVTATGGHCSDCAPTIKKILDGMAGWVPSSGFVFNLTF